VFALDTTRSKAGIALDETGISWKSDRDSLYAQVSGFVYAANSGSEACDTLLGKTGASNYTDTSGFKYCFWYPNDATTEYLYEMYPQISPLKGVTDEHFIVWMRPSSMPNFRKLYGSIEGNFKAGDVLTFNLTANFEVQSFDGTKKLVLTTQGEFGNKNSGLGEVYVTVGAICMFFAVLFAVKHLLMPRPVASVLIEKWAEVELAKSRLVGSS
jgi:hypothetical protein